MAEWLGGALRLASGDYLYKANDLRGEYGNSYVFTIKSISITFEIESLPVYPENGITLFDLSTGWEGSGVWWDRIKIYTNEDGDLDIVYSCDHYYDSGSVTLATIDNSYFSSGVVNLVWDVETLSASSIYINGELFDTMNIGQLMEMATSGGQIWYFDTSYMILSVGSGDQYGTGSVIYYDVRMDGTGEEVVPT